MTKHSLTVMHTLAELSCNAVHLHLHHMQVTRVTAPIAP